MLEGSYQRLKQHRTNTSEWKCPSIVINYITELKKGVHIRLLNRLIHKQLKTGIENSQRKNKRRALTKNRKAKSYHYDPRTFIVWRVRAKPKVVTKGFSNYL